MTPLSPFRTGLACRCPACGEGRLFRGYLHVAERCPVCGLDLAAEDSGDGPAVFIILILGFVVVALALVVEVKFEPPLWLHALLWPPLILGGALLMLRPFKATMIALQYKHKTHERGHGA
ncbi:MAG: DUF983 domain-containing protein [Alphaproteobacteria bacterium]